MQIIALTTVGKIVYGRLWVGRLENVRSIIYLAPPMQTLRSFQFLIEHFSYTHLGFFCHVHQL
jgi:hypothetical protein